MAGNQWQMNCRQALNYVRGQSRYIRYPHHLVTAAVIVLGLLEVSRKSVPGQLKHKTL